MKEQLLYAASDVSADMLYFSGVLIPDPFLAFSYQGRRIGVLSMLEINRARKSSALDGILSLEALRQEAKEVFGSSEVMAIVRLLKKRYAIEAFEVGYDFPAGLYAAVSQVMPAPAIAMGGLFKERAIKTPEALVAIKQANVAAAAGIHAAKECLRAARIAVDGTLELSGRTVTSEFVRSRIAQACLEHGAVAQNTIVACGDAACDPHERGSGPLYAHKFIIIDVFPRMESSGYYGDMSRTVIKGSPSSEQERLYQTVYSAQKMAIAALRAGAIPQKLQESVNDYFIENQYFTQKEAAPEGFIHSLGHGLGLALHESPSVSLSNQQPMLENNVVTIEPGLYYPGLGAVRIEDVLCVTAQEALLLSECPYDAVL